MQILYSIENWVITLSEHVPLGVFVFVGSIIEEIVAPIPSPLVMATAGTLAFAQGKEVLYLVFLSVIASAGKTLGCYFFYFLADKTENVILGRFGKLIGFSHKEVEGLGRHFNHTRKDDFVLILLRAIPVMPSTPISIICGFIKLDKITFIRSTFIGYFFRNLMFLYIGYVGLSTYHQMLQGFDNLESLITMFIGATLVVIIGIGYYKRGKGDLHKSLVAIGDKFKKWRDKISRNS